MLAPEELTGALVEEIRKKHKLSVGDLYQMIGFEGRSYARLNNIRVKDSWKPGDRERVAAVLNSLEGGETNLSDYAASAPARSSFTELMDEADQGAAPGFVDTDPPPPDWDGATGAWWEASGGFSGTVTHEPAPPQDGDHVAAHTGSPEPHGAPLADVHAWRCEQCGVDRTETPCANCGSHQPPKFVRPGSLPATTGSGGATTTTVYEMSPGGFVEVVDATGEIVSESPSEAEDEMTAEEFDRRLTEGEPVELDVSPAETRDETPVVAVSSPEEDGPEAYLALVSPPAVGLTEAAARDGAFLVTNGQLRTWDRCHRKWWLSWYRRLALAEEPVLGVRSTGSRIHAALEAYYAPEGTPRTDPRDALERVLTEDWTTVAKRAAERGLDEVALADLQKKFNDAASLERAMVEGYVQWLEETGADSDLRIVAPEQTLTADLNVDGRRVRVAALLDVRAVRESDGVRLFVDHKTVGDLKSPQQTLAQHPQMLHYHFLEWLNTPEGEARCDGALYNMLRRVKRTAKATPPFYDRIEVRHNQYELDAYRRHLMATTREILRATTALDLGADHHDVVPPSPTSSCSWDCDFLPVCVMFDDGSRAEDAVTALYRQIDPHERYDRDLQKGTTE